MGTQAGKLKSQVSPTTRKANGALSSGAAPLARAEIVDKATRGRFEAELDAALKRRPAGEAKLAGALRAIAPLSPALRASMAEALSVMLRRKSFDRELYGACMRSIAEAEDRQLTSLLKTALASDEAGGRRRCRRRASRAIRRSLRRSRRSRRAGSRISRSRRRSRASRAASRTERT